MGEAKCHWLRSWEAFSKAEAHTGRLATHHNPDLHHLSSMGVNSFIKASWAQPTNPPRKQGSSDIQEAQLELPTAINHTAEVNAVRVWKKSVPRPKEHPVWEGQRGTLSLNGLGAAHGEGEDDQKSPVLLGASAFRSEVLGCLHKGAAALGFTSPVSYTWSCGDTEHSKRNGQETYQRNIWQSGLQR